MGSRLRSEEKFAICSDIGDRVNKIIVAKLCKDYLIKITQYLVFYAYEKQT